jgi:hypothetical protein
MLFGIVDSEATLVLVPKQRRSKINCRSKNRCCEKDTDYNQRERKTNNDDQRIQFSKSVCDVCMYRESEGCPFNGVGDPGAISLRRDKSLKDGVLGCTWMYFV